MSKITVEALRALNSWVGVDLGPLPYKIKSDISGSGVQYHVDEEDGTPALITLTPDNEVLPDPVRRVFPLFEVELTELKEGAPVIIEGILPGNTKSELLRITRQ